MGMIKLPPFVKQHYKEILFGGLVVFGTTLLFITFNSQIHLASEDDSKMAGMDAPEIEFEAIDGSKASLKQNKGNVILVNFWASWCLPCLEEMPQLKMLENHFGSKGFILFAINVEEQPREKVKNKISRDTMPLNLIYNVAASYLGPYKVKSLPLSILIDKESKIYKVYSGSQNWMDLNMIREIDHLLK